MKRALPAALLALLVLAMWELLVRLFGVPTFLLPGPTAIAGAFWESRDLLLRHLVPTAGEAVLGFLVAAAAGVLSGVLINRSPLAERSLYPWLVVSQTLPTVAIAPILVTWFGYGTLPKVLVVTLFCFFPITVATVDGLRATDLELVRLMRSFGASKWRIFFMVEAPGALPFLFGGMRLAVTYCVIGAIVGEWVGSSEGLGFLMIQDKAQFEIPRLFAEISLLSLMGVLLFLLVALLQRLTAPWTLKRDPSL
ncbi:MAG: ABC transporter permease [Actinobacteria bacterium]|nr:ABC transporter permease [Actinomycetota bacterium]